MPVTAPRDWIRRYPPSVTKADSNTADERTPPPQAASGTLRRVQRPSAGSESLLRPSIRQRPQDSRMFRREATDLPSGNTAEKCVHRDRDDVGQRRTKSSP